MAKRIKEIPAEEADRICRDVQLWWSGTNGWQKDYPPETYRKGKTRMPSGWFWIEYGIEVELDKPEYSSDDGEG